MRELVIGTFDAAWRIAQPSVPAIYENEVIPDGPTQVMLTIVLTTEQQTTQGAAGTRRFVQQGWLQVKTWSPVNAGTAGAAAMCDSIRKILRGVSMPSPVVGDEPLTTLAPSAGPSGSDGSHWMTLTRVPFSYTERA